MKDTAVLLLKEVFLKRKMSYVQLAKLMNEKGYKETQDTIRSKVNRGAYSIQFLLEVCDTLGLDLVLQDK